MAFQNTSFNKHRDHTVAPNFSLDSGRPSGSQFDPVCQQWPERPFLPNLSRHASGFQENHFLQRENPNLAINPYHQRGISQQWHSQLDRSHNGRKRNRLSFSRWHMMISSRYKTELCRQYSEDGDCPFDEKCLFAHGQEEMRPLPRHPKYKTELCRDFHQSGFCSFGPRCNFVHSTTDFATLSAKLRQESRSSTPDSGNESCEDQNSRLSISPTLVCGETKDDESSSVFHFPEGLYRELTEDTNDDVPEIETEICTRPSLADASVTGFGHD